MTRTRTFLAFAVAPLWVPLSVVLTIFLLDSYVHQDGGVAAPGIISALVTYIGVLAIGLPAFLFLRARGWTSWKLAIALGFGAGVAMWIAFGIAFGLAFDPNLHDQMAMLQKVPLMPMIVECLLTGALGALVGITLWLIARPDRQEK